MWATLQSVDHCHIHWEIVNVKVTTLRQSCFCKYCYMESQSVQSLFCRSCHTFWWCLLSHFQWFSSRCECCGFSASPAVTCQQRSGKSLTLGPNGRINWEPVFISNDKLSKRLRSGCNIPHHDEPEINPFSHLSCFSSKTARASERASVCLTHLPHHDEPRGIPAMCLNQSRRSLQAIWALLITSLNTQGHIQSEVDKTYLTISF